jgi:hypothetical protein
MLHAFNFLFPVNKSYRDHSSHPITIPKKYYGNEVIQVLRTDTSTDVSINADGHNISGYIYSGVAGYGRYYQLRIDNDNFSRVPISCVNASKLVVGIGVERDNVIVSLISEGQTSLDETSGRQESFRPLSKGASVEYELSKPGDVVISVFDLSGLLVRRLEESDKTPGRYVIHWDGLDEVGKQLSGGVYLVRVQAKD